MPESGPGLMEVPASASEVIMKLELELELEDCAAACGKSESEAEMIPAARGMILRGGSRTHSRLSLAQLPQVG